MDTLKGQSSAGQYTSKPLSVVGSNKGWAPLSSAATTNGGGGDDGLGERVATLETHVEHVQKDVGEIKEDLREIRTGGIALIFTAFAAIGGLYLYLNSKTSGLSSDIGKLRLEVTKEFSSVKVNMGKVSSQNEGIIKQVGSLESSINKLVDQSAPIQEKKQK